MSNSPHICAQPSASSIPSAGRGGRRRVFFIEDAVSTLGAFGLIMLVQALFGALVDPDGYYHVRMAALYADGSVPAAGADYHWARHSLWNGMFSDKDYLWHLFVMPFTMIAGDSPAALEQAGMFAAATGAALIALIAVRVFRAQGLMRPWVWALLLITSSEVFLYRITMCRAHLLSIAFCLLGWHMIQRRALLSLALISALYALAYTGPHILIVIALLWGLIEFIAPREDMAGVSRTRHLLRAVLPALTVAGGIALGLLLHPQPGNMARLWVVQNLAVPLHNYGLHPIAQWLGDAAGLEAAEQALAPVKDIGLEMRELGGRVLLFGHFIGLGLLIIPWVLATVCRVRPDRTDAFAYLTAFLALAMMLISNRFCEYFCPFAMLAGGRLLSRVFASDPFAAFLDRRERLFGRVTWVAGLVGILLALNVGVKVANLTWQIRNHPRPDAIRPACDAINRFVPEGEGVFHGAWDQFPYLLFHAPRRDFVIGLDPTFMAMRSPDLYRKYQTVITGEQEFDGKSILTEDMIYRDFGMRYVVVLKSSTPGLALALQRAEKRAAGLGAINVVRLAADPDDAWRLYELRPRAAAGASPPP